MSDSASTSAPLDDKAWLSIHRHIEEFEDAWTRGEPIAIEQAIAGLEGAALAECLAHALAVELECRRFGLEPWTSSRPMQCARN
jgi:hypothetical protein